MWKNIGIFPHKLLFLQNIGIIPKSTKARNKNLTSYYHTKTSTVNILVSFILIFLLYTFYMIETILYLSFLCTALFTDMLLWTNQLFLVTIKSSQSFNDLIFYKLDEPRIIIISLLFTVRLLSTFYHKQCWIQLYLCKKRKALFF